MNPNVILVPLDGSPVSEAALPFAEALSAAERRRIRLFTVVETVLDGLLPQRVKLNGVLETARTESARKSLHRIAEELRSRGREVETETAVGEPVAEVGHAAGCEDVAMIVMATHGRGGADRFVLGSVADKVMRSAVKPVVLVRPPANGGPPAGVMFRRLLVPLDGSPLALAALDHAIDIALATGATLILVRVVPYLTSLMNWGTGYVPELLEIEAEMAADALESLEDVRAGLPKSVRTEVLVLRGPPAITLEDYVHEHPVDLTIMSTHGRGGLSRFILGSTADRLVHSGAQVMLVHGVEDETKRPKLDRRSRPIATLLTK